MAAPFLLIATGSAKEAQTATAGTAKPGGPVREVVLEVAMVIVDTHGLHSWGLAIKHSCASANRLLHVPRSQ